MEKKSGTAENVSELPTGGGSIRSIGDSFQPNLAMGGGSYKVPIELPQGPGGFSPKLDLIYNTGFGNGPLGMGWVASVPYVERKRASPFVPQGEIEYSLSGAETLVPTGAGTFVPFIAQISQEFRFNGTEWMSRAPNLVSMRFGSTSESRIEGVVDAQPRVVRWLLDRVTFPGDRQVTYEYEADGSQRYLKRIRWSVFRVEWEYENRPDEFSQFDTGFELRTRRRLRRLRLQQDRLAPESLTREYRFDYVPAERVGTSLLTQIHVTGFRLENGTLAQTALAPLTFGYTGFSPDARRIMKFESNTIPPPLLGDDVTLLDYRGTALPGILRMNGDEATFWENRGAHQWGPPQRLAGLPQGLHLGNDQVRFADLTGNGTADLLVGRALGGGFYPHDPEQGFLPKQFTTLAPSFDLGEEGSFLLDLDGDRIVDLLTFRNGSPMVFFNRRGERWDGPVALPSAQLPNFNQQQPRLRFADMNGDGMPDMVMLRSRQITYWPALGNGRWGAPRVMAQTPEFAVPNPDEDVYLTDLDGDGTSDLILVGRGEIRIYLNARGENFSQPFVLNRTPRLSVEQFLLADLTGSGTPGFLWCLDAAASVPHLYWFLDPLNGVKPYLLETIDNGSGLSTTIEYTTSAFERTADLQEGSRWSGYLPFAVHVVKRMIQTDRVTGQTQATEYRYHDGHYDGRAREYLGFAQVESVRQATAHEAAVRQRFYFHNRGTSADDPAFIAGKGQPHRSELIDSATGMLRRVEESVWVAQPVTTISSDRPAYLALEQSRVSRRLQNGVDYERESVEFQYDAVGNVVRERRIGEWNDRSNIRQTSELILETAYATHPTHGLSSLPCRLKRTDGAGRVLKHFTIFYDGAAFVGLSFGQLTNGYKTRQTEIALTSAEIAESYNGTVPPLITTLYRLENDPQLGPVFVKDVYRYRNDALGNQIETLDPIGHRVTITYDAEAIHPISISEDGGPARAMTFDQIAQQAARVTDLNGNVIETRYDGLGNIVAVFQRGANSERPTESYEYRRNVVPHVTVRRVRLLPDEPEGAVKFQYHDGAGRIYQERTLSEDGRWAVGKQEVRSITGQTLIERDAYYSPTSDFEATPPAGLASRSLFYDFAGRVIEERLFDGRPTRYVYDRNETRFYDPVSAVAFAADPATPPSRISRASAAGKVVSIEEIDAAGRYEERRDFDALARLVKITDSRGHVVLDRSFDLWGNCLRSASAEAGLTTSVFDAANNEVWRADADGRGVYTPRDVRGRITEVRNSGPTGSIEEAYTYDTGPGENLSGRLARVVGAFGTVEYSYSVDGDATLVRRTFTGNPNTYELRFGYDHQRRVRFVQYPDATRVNYNYHPTGLLASIPGYIESIQYGPTGKRERIVFRNGLETRRKMTPGDYLLTELLTQTVVAGGPKFQHLVYQLDPLGRVSRIDDLSTVTGKVRNNQTFEYDQRNRVARATGRGADGDYDFRYRYDELSNLTFSGESFAEDMDYGLQLGDVQHPNRLIKRHAAGAPEYGYDNTGRLTADPGLGTLNYDTRGRLVRAEKPDGTVVEYRYDHNDHRTESRVTSGGTTTVRHDCDGVFLIEGASATKIVFDDDRRLAVVPQTGDPLLHHLDRLGNVNVVSNLQTGAFVGHDEYTPYGRLSVSIVIMPNFHFQGARFSDGLDLVLLGARHYRPMLGRFITPDLYLIINPDKITGILAATNLYLYGLANPVNFTDPTGQIAFLAVLLIAVIVGAALGALGAAIAGAQTWDEWLLWIIGGAIGAALTVLTFGGFAVLLGASAATATTVAIVALIVWSAASLLGSIFCPLMDKSDSKFLWGVSFFLKWVQSPITTTVGIIAWLVVMAAGGKTDFRNGMLFIEVGPGYGALTLGAVAWTLEDGFNSDGSVKEDLARHEAYHSRQVVALGELGFYFTYITVGGIFGVATGGPWIGLGADGCGNPFEKTPWPYDHPGAPTRSASQC